MKNIICSILFVFLTVSATYGQSDTTKEINSFSSEKAVVESFTTTFNDMNKAYNKCIDTSLLNINVCVYYVVKTLSNQSILLNEESKFLGKKLDYELTKSVAMHFVETNSEMKQINKLMNVAILLTPDPLNVKNFNLWAHELNKYQFNTWDYFFHKNKL